MRIDNQTQWNTADLRAIFAKVLTKWNQQDDRKVPSKRLKHITVVYSRWAGHSGYAYLNSGTIRIRMPKPYRMEKPKGFSGTEVRDGKTWGVWHWTEGPPHRVQIAINPRDLAFLFEHELAHAAGWNHDQMGPLNSWKLVETNRYAYVDGMQVRLQGPKPKPAAKDQQVVRYDALVERRKAWLTKQKRAATALKKIAASIRRYEKLFAADGRLAAIRKK